MIVTKMEMSQIFDDTGKVIPITWVLTKSSDEALSIKEGDVIKVIGTSKGKGFQGVVKRHGFHGGSRTHGQKHSEREPGAIGGGGGRAGGRVAKGIRMAGRMGSDRVTVRNLKIVKILPEQNLIAISGAVPGHRGSKMEIQALA
ncbi:MAG TPA: 50S ribosomal protein L3 [Candidatus Paceibacterota bacterium]